VVPILAGILISGTFSQQNWEKAQDKDGIRVFTRMVKGSGCREFRAEMGLGGINIQQVADVILDIDNYDMLFPDCHHPKILNKNNNKGIVYYLITKTPWPFKDRDGIYEQTVHTSSDDSTIFIAIKVLPEYVPEIKKYERIQYGKGFWELKHLGQDMVYVAYQFHADPKVNIPDWVSRHFLVENPYHTLQNLRTIIKNSQNK
jgi:ribosome-associated toxin RatA of RatAB toxin-antitoxin module